MNFPNTFAVLGLLFVSLAASAETIDCRVIGIADGDTLTCLTAGKKQIKVRLAEIDTPEKAQPYGTRSRQALSDLVFGKDVTLLVQDRDRYGRTVARIKVGSTDVNREMVSQGAAWVYRAYNRDKSLLQAEAQAKAGKRGLWALPEAERMAPWDWRKDRRSGIVSQAASASTKASPAGFTCSATKLCREMSGCAEAKFQLQQCGNPRIDGDGDGIPCEAICR